MKTIFPQLSQISDQQLIAEIKDWAHNERLSTAGLIARLAELDERALYLKQGCASLFTYCTEVLLLSEAATYPRIQAARAARKFPVIFEMLSKGDVNLTTVKLLAPHLTTENHARLLAAARHRSKREVEKLVADEHPRPDAPNKIRKLPAAKPPESVLPVAAAMDPSPDVSRHLGQEPQTAVPAPTVGAARVASSASSDFVLAPPAVKEPPAITPLGAERYKFQFTGSGEMLAKLCRVQDLMRHQIPDGNASRLFERALDALLEKLEKTRLGIVKKPRDAGRRAGHSDAPPNARPAARSEVRSDMRPAAASKTEPDARHTEPSAEPNSRYIPAAVKRAVWRRDGGRCAYVSSEGRRCRETGRLQFHHIDPHAANGPATIGNISLRCAAHNLYEAELYFGAKKIAEKRKAAQNKAALRKAAIRSGAIRSGQQTGSAKDDPPLVKESPAMYGVRMKLRMRSLRLVPEPVAVHIMGRAIEFKMSSSASGTS